MTDTITATADISLPPEPAPTPVVDFDQFVSAAPKELQEAFQKNGVKDLETLTKSYNGLNSMLGKKGLIKPAEGASEDEIKAYKQSLYKEIGVPETGEYEFSLPEGIDDKYIDQKFLDELAGVAADNGVGATAFQAIIDKVMGAYKGMLDSALNPDYSGLQKTWGKEFDANMQAAKGFYDRLLKDNPLGEAINAKFGNDPDMLALAHALSKKLGEDSLSNTPTQTTSADYKTMGLQKTKEAMVARDKGDYKLAEKLQEEAREYYSKAV